MTPEGTTLEKRFATSPELRERLEQRLRRGLRRTEAASAVHAMPKGAGAQRIVPRPQGEPHPLSFAQQRLWFLEQLEPGTPLYNVPQALRLSGPLQLPCLERAFTEIIRRHEVLRTGIEKQAGEPVQIVRSARPFSLTVIDLQHRDDAERQAELNWRMTAEAQRPFDLARDFLMRATLFRLAPLEHVLLVTQHHIASDAWSMNLLFEELASFYNAELRASNRDSNLSEMRNSNLLPLPIQYGDFARWQRLTFDSQLSTFNAQLSYWREKLASAPALDLPTDRPRSTGTSFRGATRSTVIPSSLIREVQRLGQREGATLFMTLLAAFKLLLFRYSGQTDLLVGCPVAGRQRLETERLIGFFLNTLVLRSDLSGQPTTLELIRRVRDACIEGFAHQDLPFDKLVEDLQPERYVNRTPFFQVMFTLQTAENLRVGELKVAKDFDGLDSEPVEVDLGVSPFDLTLFTEETQQGLLASIEYKTDLFDAATIEGMLSAFGVILEGMTTDPSRSISEIPVLGGAEKNRILVEWNDTSADYPRQRQIHELIAEQAASAPEAPAVIFGQRQLTYAKLEKRASELAQRLRQAGLQPGMRAAICLDRSADMVVALLAVLKVGAAYMPLDLGEPRERLAFKVQDSGVAVVITHHDLHQTVREIVGDNGKTASLPVPCVLVLDRPESDRRFNSATVQRFDDLTSVAYIIYTSGSSGTPKGVLIHHQALVNHSFGFARRFEISSRDRILQFAPLSFDVSGEEIFPALLSGAAVVMRPDYLSFSVRDFHAFVEKEGITVLNLPTPYWAEWMREMESSKLQVPPSVRLVVVGTDTVAIDQFRLWRRLARKNIRWCNAYGATEATITSTIYEPSHNDYSQSSVPIGRPVANTQVFVLDAAQQPVPVGVHGELYIGGDQIALGYLNRPDLTAEKFVSSVPSLPSVRRLYRTGDLARWRADGNLEFLGRKDHQVKIRGFRVELGEIEAALLQYTDVKEAVVAARDDISGEKRLVAYVVPTKTVPQLPGKLVTFLKTKLPAYMIPSAVVELAAFPLLPSGKVDRKSLPPPPASRPDLQAAFVPAADGLQEQLVKIWCQVLGLPTVGIHDNFFDLGGHSMLAIKMAAEIEKFTGRNLPVVLLFQSPTIAELAAAMRREEQGSGSSSLLPIQPHGGKPPLFLVHGAGGGMLWGYGNLAKYLPQDQPVYVFNSRGMRGLDEFPAVEDIAAEYVKELVSFHRAPYYLGGYCFGGEIAFEMARQLTARGEEVAFLAMFNAMPPNSSFERIRLTPVFFARFAWNTMLWLNYFRTWNPELRRSFVKRKWNVLRKALTARFTRVDRGSQPVQAEDWIDVSEYPDYQRQLWDVHLTASRKYVPGPYDGQITVFRTRIHPFLCSFDPAFGWGEFARGGVSVRTVPGAHESILDEPYVRVLANELDQCLRECYSRRLAGQLSTVGSNPTLTCLVGMLQLALGL